MLKYIFMRSTLNRKSSACFSTIPLQAATISNVWLYSLNHTRNDLVCLRSRFNRKGNWYYKWIYPGQNIENFKKWKDSCKNFFRKIHEYCSHCTEYHQIFSFGTNKDMILLKEFIRVEHVERLEGKDFLI